MEIWAWIGFGCVVIVGFAVLMAVVALTSKRLGQTVQGFMMMGFAMAYSSMVTWMIMDHVAKLQ
jgi:hypothetical protein